MPSLLYVAGVFIILKLHDSTLQWMSSAISDLCYSKNYYSKMNKSISTPNHL